MLKTISKSQKQLDYDAWIEGILSAKPNKNIKYVPQNRNFNDMIKLYGHLGSDPEKDVSWGVDVGEEIIRD